MDWERLSVARVVVGSSWREEMGEQRADSCTEVNRRSLCVLPTKKKSVTNYLCLSLKRELWRHLWVGAEKGCMEAVVEKNSEVVITGRDPKNSNVL